MGTENAKNAIEHYSEVLKAEYERLQRQLARIDELTLEIETRQAEDRIRAAK